MNVSTARPILISIAQYQEELVAGTLGVLDLVDKARSFGVQGIELRPELWPGLRSELISVRERLQDLGLMATYATRSWLFTPGVGAQIALLDDIDTAAALGCSLLRIFTGSVPPDDADSAWEGALAAVDHAQGRDVVLALENYSGSPGARSSRSGTYSTAFRRPAWRPPSISATTQPTAKTCRPLFEPLATVRPMCT